MDNGAPFNGALYVMVYYIMALSGLPALRAARGRAPRGGRRALRGPGAPGLLQAPRLGGLGVAPRQPAQVPGPSTARQYIIHHIMVHLF